MSAEAFYRQGMVAIQAQKMEEARKLLAEAVRRDPSHEKAWLALASVVPDMEQAVDCLKRVLAINPENRMAQEWLELARRERNRQLSAKRPQQIGLTEILLEQPGDEDRPVPRLGQYLLEYRFISTDQLKEALHLQREAAGTGSLRKLGDILLEQGMLSKERLEFALREQHRNFYSMIE
jgi:tetratricopeptide (TPR) repeat protein